jgi:hypothetical protein
LTSGDLPVALQCNRLAGYGNGEQYRKYDDGARVAFALHQAIRIRICIMAYIRIQGDSGFRS